VTRTSRRREPNTILSLLSMEKYEASMRIDRGIRNRTGAPASNERARSGRRAGFPPSIQYKSFSTGTRKLFP